MEWKTVNDLYTYASTNNLKLLSNYNATFWSDYITNYTRYDKLFNRMYASFRYFYQDESSVIGTLTTNFIDDVYNHLLINTKKYEELYRIHVLADNNYSITNDVNLTEVMDRDKNETGSYTQGSRSDSTSTSLGAKTDTTESQVAAYNSSSYSNQEKVSDVSGAQSNSESYTKGQQIDGTDVDYTDNYTLTRTGNNGNKSVAELLKQHQELWTTYEFYSYIFREICAELLLV